MSFLGNLFGEKKSNHLRTENIADPGVKKGIDNLMGKPVQITREGDRTDVPVQKNVESCSKDSNGKNFSGLESRIKLGNYKDRMGALDELKGDRSSKAIEILSWLMHNGNSNLGEITKFNERAIAAGFLGKIGGEEVLFSSLNASSQWAKSGAVKGLAFMFVDGELDIKEKIQGLNLNRCCECICSKNDNEEKQIHNMVVDKLLQ